MAIREGLLLGMGNPLLDIQARVETSFLDKYGLKADNAILCDEKLVPLFHDMVEKYDVEYIAGGATQNSMRVCHWIVGVPRTAAFFGCVGNDHFGQVLEEKAKSVGLNVRYQRHDTEKTGTCAACITGESRSLCAHLAAANCFTLAHLEKPENKALVENAQFYYIAGFFLTVCPPAIQMVAEHACANNKVLMMNLSAPFLISVFKEPMMNALPYVDILFGNETEAGAFADEHKFETKKITEIALKLSQLPKKNDKRPRIVIITQGADPVVIAQNGQVKEHQAIRLDKDQLVDTNGAGDAFVGGFLAQYIQGKPIEEAIKCGNWAASIIIQQQGCTFPAVCTYKS